MKKITAALSASVIFIFLLVCIFVLLYNPNNPGNSGNNSSTNQMNNMPSQTNGLSNNTKETMINLALSNESVKKYIDDKGYDINTVDVEKQMVIINVGNMTGSWFKLLVLVDVNQSCVLNVIWSPQTPVRVAPNLPA